MVKYDLEKVYIDVEYYPEPDGEPSVIEWIRLPKESWNQVYTAIEVCVDGHTFRLFNVLYPIITLIYLKIQSYEREYNKD